MNVLKLRRPWDPADELHVYIGREHNCAAGKLKRNVEGAEKFEADGGDYVLFPVGHYGQGVPGGVPFEVVSTEPCPACDAYVHVWAEWVTPHVVDFGSAA